MDRPTLEERYGRAVTSHNLRQDPNSVAPVDLLTAAGLVGRRHALGLSLWRLAVVNDVAEFEAAVRGLAKLAMDVRRRQPRIWPGMGLGNAEEVAREVLLCWWRRTCPRCEGRGYMVIPGTPTLSDVPCPSCGGGGDVDVPRHLARTLGAEAVDPGRWMLGEIGAIERVVESAMLQVSG